MIWAFYGYQKMTTANTNVQWSCGMEKYVFRSFKYQPWVSHTSVCTLSWVILKIYLGKHVWYESQLHAFCWLGTVRSHDICREINYHILVLVICKTVSWRVRCSVMFNSLASGILELHVSRISLKLILVIDGCGISCEFALRWMSQDLLRISRHWFR